MSPELREAVEHLYEVFARYPRPPSVEGCPCCVSASDRARLHRAPLRGLESDDLRRFAFNALTTWGDEHDFRHFLPRILELVAHPADPLGVHPQVVLGKLPYGGWESWPDDERAAIDRWMDGWWGDALTQTAQTWRMPEVLASILLTGRELGPARERIRPWWAPAGPPLRAPRRGREAAGGFAGALVPADGGAARGRSSARPGMIGWRRELLTDRCAARAGNRAARAPCGRSGLWRVGRSGPFADACAVADHAW